MYKTNYKKIRNKVWKIKRFKKYYVISYEEAFFIIS